MYRNATLGLLAVCIGLTGCGGGGGGGGTTPTGGGSTTVDSLNVAAGDTRQLTTDELVVNGDATIDGTLQMAGDRLVLRATGNLTINGTITPATRGRALEPVDFDDSVSFASQPKGLDLVVGETLTCGENCVVNSAGPTMVTDDASQLDRTPAQIQDESDSASGDLPTLVPLPPDDDVFKQALSVVHTPIVARSVAGRRAPAPHFLRGIWNGIPPAIRFHGASPMHIGNFTVNAPPAANGAAGKTGKSGDDGKRGQNLYIWNNGGPINVVGKVVLNLTDGGNGGSDTKECGSATGGNGGAAGNFRMTASGGIDLSKGTLIINPGRGGNGGDATATGKKAAAGCPGAKGCDAKATGGKGADNKKRLYARGNVAGIANITLGPVVGGSGGNATATAGTGGDGQDCQTSTCAGGAGGKATATGGAGGAASLSVKGLTVGGVAATQAGNGGTATATGGAGGTGGDHKTQAGSGGVGGDAIATGGAGGDGDAGGNGGNATATGGAGGTGGDSPGAPGAGGMAGNGTATAGAGGSHGGNGAQNGTRGADGNAGQMKNVCGGPVTLIEVNPTSITNTHTVGTTSCPQTVGSFTVFNQSSSTVTYTATVNNSVFEVSPASGSIPAGGTATITVTFNCADFPPQTATVSIQAQGGGSTQTKTVQVTLNSGP